MLRGNFGNSEEANEEDECGDVCLDLVGVLTLVTLAVWSGHGFWSQHVCLVVVVVGRLIEEGTNFYKCLKLFLGNKTWRGLFWSPHVRSVWELPKLPRSMWA